MPEKHIRIYSACLAPLDEHTRVSGPELVTSEPPVQPYPPGGICLSASLPHTLTLPKNRNGPVGIGTHPSTQLPSETLCSIHSCRTAHTWSQAPHPPHLRRRRCSSSQSTSSIRRQSRSHSLPLCLSNTRPRRRPRPLRSRVDPSRVGRGSRCSPQAHPASHPAPLIPSHPRPLQVEVEMHPSPARARARARASQARGRAGVLPRTGTMRRRRGVGPRSRRRHVSGRHLLPVRCD